MKILLTGFEPFQRAALNPSLEVVKALSGLPEIDGIILPVAFKHVFETVKAKLEENKYDFVILLGQAGGRSEVCLERVAVNLIDTDIADEEGHKWFDRKIQDLGPDAFLSHLPLRRWQETLKVEHGLPVEISNTAGLFVCNYLYYQVLHHYKIPCLFAHLPYLPEQGTPSLSLDIMIDSVRGLIDQCKALGEIK